MDCAVLKCFADRFHRFQHMVMFQDIRLSCWCHRGVSCHLVCHDVCAVALLADIGTVINMDRDPMFLRSLGFALIAYRPLREYDVIDLHVIIEARFDKLVSDLLLEVSLTMLVTLARMESMNRLSLPTRPAALLRAGYASGCTPLDPCDITPFQSSDKRCVTGLVGLTLGLGFIVTLVSAAALGGWTSGCGVSVMRDDAAVGLEDVASCVSKFEADLLLAWWRL